MAWLNNKQIAIALTFIIMLFVWVANANHLDAQIARIGYSPLVYVYKYFFPDNFIKDYPGGTQLFDKSSYMHIYKYAYSLLGIPPEVMVYVSMGLQLSFLTFAAYYLGLFIFRYDSNWLPLIFTALIISSEARNMNIANYGSPPSPIGMTHWYNCAEALRIMAIAFALRRRMVLAGLFLGLCFTVVPTIALTAGAFLLGYVIYSPGLIRSKDVLKGSILCVGISLLWIFVSFDLTTILSTSIPKAEYIKYTLLTSFHMYPYERGLLTVHCQDKLIPFLSFMICLLCFVRRKNPLNDEDKPIFAGLFIVSFVCILGLIFSFTKVSIFAIKLSLHRSNDIMIILGIAILLREIWRGLGVSDLLSITIFVGILLSPFVQAPGFPLIYSAVLLAQSSIYDRKLFWKRISFWLAVALMAICVLLLVGNYEKMQPQWYKSPAVVGTPLLWAVTGLVLVLLIIHHYFLNIYRTRVLQTCIVIFVLFGSLYWAGAERYFRIPEVQIRGMKNYMAAQIWARKNTPKDALFMVDPVLSYGWRDYARRASFGVLHSWLLVGWVYNGDIKTFREGLKRFQEFGVNSDRYIAMRPTSRAWRRLRQKIQSLYYTFDDKWRLKLARKYGIDYFVMLKKLMVSKVNLPLVYENDDFAIYKASKNL